MAGAPRSVARPEDEAKPKRRPLPVNERRTLAVIVAVLAAPLAGASPTGSTPTDWLWSAAIAGAAAFYAATAKRGALLAAAAVAVVGAGEVGAALVGLVSAVAAATSTWHLGRRATFARGLAGGAAATSLLASADNHDPLLVGFAWALVLGTIVASGWLHASDEVRRRSLWVLLGLVVLSGVAVASTALGVLGVRSKVDGGLASLRHGFELAATGDPAGAALELEAAADAFEEADGELAIWGVAGRLLPAVSQNVQAARGALDEVARAAETAATAADDVDVNDLVVARGRVDLAAVAALEGPLGDLADRLDAVVDEVERWDDAPLMPPLRNRMDDLGFRARRARADAVLGEQAAGALPVLLGADAPTRYLVLFTTPSEARGRFGFPGSFAELVFDDGQMSLGEHGSVSQVLVEGGPQDLVLTDDPDLQPYVGLGSTLDLRNATLPPNFPAAARLAADLWAQTGRAPVDGVLRFDPASLAPLLAITGPVEDESVGRPLTAENVEQFLLFDQYVQFPDSQAPRRELLETVSDVTFERLVGSDLPAPRVLAELFAPLVRANHLNAVAFDEDADGFLAALGLSGTFPAGTADELLVTNNNEVANKIDIFLERTVEYRARVDTDDGEATGVLTVTLANGAPAAELPAYVIGSPVQPRVEPGTNRTALLVYTGMPATEVRLDGEPVAFGVRRTDGRYLHIVEVELPPGGTAVVELTLEGTLDLDARDGYRLTLRPGGGATPDHYDVVVTSDERPLARTEADITEPVELGG